MRDFSLIGRFPPRCERCLTPYHIFRFQFLAQLFPLVRIWKGTHGFFGVSVPGGIDSSEAPAPSDAIRFCFRPWIAWSRAQKPETGLPGIDSRPKTLNQLLSLSA